MSTEHQPIREVMDDQDLSMQLFMAQMANNEQMVANLENLIDAVNIARENNLEVEIYRDKDGEVSFEVRKQVKKQYGFHTLYENNRD